MNKDLKEVTDERVHRAQGCRESVLAIEKNKGTGLRSGVCQTCLSNNQEVRSGVNEGESSHR